MTVIDIVLVTLIGFGAAKGLYRGLLVEVASLLAIFIGAYGAARFSNHAGVLITKNFDWSENTVSIIAFIITFLAIFFAISFVGKALTKLASLAYLGILNKALGGFFGGLKVAVLISVVLMVLDALNTNLPIVSETSIAESVFCKPVQAIAPAILPNIAGDNSPLNILELPQP
ncbi:MAG: colicin V production protein [Flavobacteriaceae bacterium]|nr:colicin V production protein [Flavobacteriaceae bacterium]